MAETIKGRIFMTIGFFTEVLGTDSNDNITGSDLQIIYSLKGDDNLSSSFGSLSEGEDSTFLIGGSGADRYTVENNSSIAILDNGNSSNDILNVSGIGFNRDTSFLAEIDSRHLYIGDILSNQYVLLIDWQQPQNRIETAQLSDVTVTYDEIFNNFRQLEGYEGNFSWEQLEALGELDLGRLGLSSSSINNSISQVVARSIELEGNTPPVANDNFYTNGFNTLLNISNPSVGVLQGDTDADGDNLIANLASQPSNGTVSLNGDGSFLYTPNNGFIGEDSFTYTVNDGQANSNPATVTIRTNPNPVCNDPVLDTPLNRFQNSSLSGTFLFAGLDESQSIRQEFTQFNEEGFAFCVASEPGDNLVRFNRFQNSAVPGTYLFASEEESVNIRENFIPPFVEEGIAFYAYGADANIGQDVIRFQNSQRPGTYIFVLPEEAASIRANFPQFIEEGVAFEVAV